MEKVTRVKKRNDVRMDHNFNVTLSVLTMSEEAKEKISLPLINISASGILVVSYKLFSVDTLLKIDIHIQQWEKYSSRFLKYDQTSVSRPFTAIGRVARILPTGEGKGYYLGIEFVNCDSVDQTALRRYVDSLKAA